MSGHELPPDWTLRSLKQSGTWAGGGTPSKQNAAFWTGGDIPWVSPKDMKQFVIDSAEDLITGLALADSTTNLIPSGSVLLVTRSGILQRTLPVGLTVVPVAINQDMKALTPDEAIRADFLARFLVSQERQILEACRKSGTTVASLETDKLMEVEVPVPPLNEQKRIVAKLEAVQARAEAAKAALDAVGGLLEKFRQSVLAAAFRGDLTRAWRAQNPNTEPASALLTRIRAERRRRWQAANPKKQYTEPAPVDPTGLPDLPEGWCWASVDELCWDGPTNGYSGPVEDGANGTLTMKLSATTQGKLIINSATTKRLTETLPDDSKFWLEPGDILVQRANSLNFLGAAAIYRPGAERIVYPDLMMRLRSALPEYTTLLWHYFNSAACRHWFRSNATGTAGNMPKINGSVLRSTLVPVPPPGEATRLASLIQEALGLSESVVECVDALFVRANNLTQATLAKAFRGELVPQHPDDEPASALLARIAAERTTETPKRRGRRPKA